MSVDRKVVPLRGREKARPQSIYDKLEKARKRRAETLGAKPPANTPEPVRKPVGVARDPVGRQVEERPVAVTGAKPAQVEESTTVEPRAPERDAPEAIPYARAETEAPARTREKPSRILIATAVAFCAVAGLLLLPRGEAALPSETVPVVGEVATGEPVQMPDEDVSGVTAPLVAEEVTAPDVPDLPQPQVFDVALLATVPEEQTAAFGVAAIDPVGRREAVGLPATPSASGFPVLTGAPEPLEIPRPAPRPEGGDPVVAALVEALESEAISEPAPALADEPGLLAGTEVYLHAPTGLAASEVDAMQARIESLGVPSVAVRPTGFRISQSNIRYFHASDAAAAEAIGEAMGARVRDFTDFEPKPREGLIEVWLSGAPRAVQQVTPVRAVTPRVGAPQPSATTRISTSGRDGGSGPSLTRIVQDVAKTVETGAREAVKTVSDGVSSGVDKIRGKRKGQNK